MPPKRISFVMLPKGRRKFRLISSIKSNTKLIEKHFLTLTYCCYLIIIFLISNNISSVQSLAIKYDESEILQKLSPSSTFDDSEDIFVDTDIDGIGGGQEISSIVPNIDNNRNTSILHKDYYFDQLTTNNPCLVHYCPKRRECVVDHKTNQPLCVCQRHCSQRKRLICGSNGQIYKNHCRLHQASCLIGASITYQRLEKCLNRNRTTNKPQTHFKLLSPSSSPSSLLSSSSSLSLPTTLISLSSSTSSEINKSNRFNKKYHSKQSDTKFDFIHKDNNNNNNNDKDNINVDNSHNFKQHKIVEIFNVTSSAHVAALKSLNNNNNNHEDNENRKSIVFKTSSSTKPIHDHDDDIDDIDDNDNGHSLINKKTYNNEHRTNTTSITHNENDFIEATIYNRKKLCTSQEYEIMKDNLLLFNHARLMSQDNNHSKDFLVSIMFSHYDQNNDAYLEIEELNQISVDEHLEELSNGCVLEDMLNFDDIDGDERLSINEFYQAFSKLYSVSVVSLDKALETNHLSARVGDNVEIKCDVTGSPSPPIIWRRDDIDLSTINSDDIRVFSDGSLYLTRIQLVHSGNYTCHAQRNKDVVQTHILNVYTIPQVLVMPRIQSKRPGENAEMWCHVTGDPLPKVEWLKNDDRLNQNLSEKYEIIGNGTALRIRDIQYSDTGAYMCQAKNIGGTVRDISSLIVQEEPTPTILNEERKFFVFHEIGISIYEPSACRLYHQIQGTDIIPGTQEYVCGEKDVKCSWGRAINAGTRYIYASQPNLDRVLVISTIQMVVVDVIPTDKYPIELHYVQKLDQIWLLNWRFEHNADTKTIQVIREAGQKRKHHTVHPEPIDGQFDLVRNLFIPSSELEQPHFSFNYGYVTHKNQRGVYKLDLENLRYTKYVDLTLHNCVPEYIEFSALYGFVIMSCREPITNRPQGQLVLDYLTDAVLSVKLSLYGIPKISPDSRHLVTIQHNLNEVVIVVQKITRNGLEFLFDVKTTLNISDVTFYESQTMHGYDLFASANDKENILYLNLCTGKVEMITGVGLPIPMSSIEWGNPGRVIRSSGLFGLYMLTTANNALFVINGKARTVNCEIGGVEHPTAIVWTHSLSNYVTNRSINEV